MADWGYGRVSTKKAKGRKAQHVDNQVERLVSEGIGRDHILVDDGVSGRKASRPQWDKLLTLMKPGDTLTAVSMTRIGRSTQELLKLMTEFDERGINVRFLDKDIDTSTANGRLFFHIMAALAEYEADLTRERVTDGLEAARERHGGKLPTRGPSFTGQQRKEAEELLRSTTFSTSRVAAAIGVSRATLYRHVDVEQIRGEAGK
jgi:DNA invertase Pin-like site-specific DNA recombinase